MLTSYPFLTIAIVTLALGLRVAPLRADAQSLTRVYRIGALSASAPPAEPDRQQRLPFCAPF
jgi:hypothetical protein